MNPKQYKCNIRALILAGIFNLPTFSVTEKSDKQSPYTPEQPLFTWYTFRNTVSEVDVSCLVALRDNARDIVQMDEDITIGHSLEYMDFMNIDNFYVRLL
jgi:hypothetical protein